MSYYIAPRPNPFSPNGKAYGWVQTTGFTDGMGPVGKILLFVGAVYLLAKVTNTKVSFPFLTRRKTKKLYRRNPRRVVRRRARDVYHARRTYRRKKRGAHIRRYYAKQVYSHMTPEVRAEWDDGD